MGAVLQRGALASGFDTERWTLRRITRVLRREFGVTYHPHALSALLGAHGWSPQRPATRRRARRGTDRGLAQARLAGSEKGVRRDGFVVAFLDERGHTCRARVSRTWAPRGQTPVLERVSRRREVSRVVLLTAPLDGRPAQLYARHFVGTIHATELLESLRYF